VRAWGSGRAWALRAGGAAAALAAFLFGFGVGGAASNGTTVAPVRQVRSVTVPVKAVALTFDDGPSPQYTPTILDLLDQNGARATFFVIGQELVRHPEIARQAAQDGMELANHGFHHLTLLGLDPTAIEAEAMPVERELTAITGSRPTLYRLPKGRGDPRALRALTDMGYTIVYWSVDTRDYLPRSPAAIVAQVQKQLQPGSIVIFHDGGGNQQHTVDALKQLLPALKAQGWQLVTVSQLLELAKQS
jgi:peptidoglycan/xylan/chitin deacetylase (PgdA/CDA1 family)